MVGIVEVGVSNSDSVETRKTLMYYLRTVPKSTTQQFTIKPSTINNTSQESDNSTDNSEICEMCAG